MSLDIDLIPNRCPHCGRGDEGFSANITHNLGKMASEAGIYEMLWHPERAEVKCARQLIEPLNNAIAAMKAEPERFDKFNAPNGWGTRVQFVPWLEELLAACEKDPDATVRSDI